MAWKLLTGSGPFSRFSLSVRNSYMSDNRRFNPALQQRPAVASNPLRLAIARFLTAALAVGLLSNAALANEPADTDTARDHAPHLQTEVVTDRKRAQHITED